MIVLKCDVCEKNIEESDKFQKVYISEEQCGKTNKKRHGIVKHICDDCWNDIFNFVETKITGEEN